MEVYLEQLEFKRASTHPEDATSREVLMEDLAPPAGPKIGNGANHPDAGTVPGAMRIKPPTEDLPPKKMAQRGSQESRDKERQSTRKLARNRKNQEIRRMMRPGGNAEPEEKEANDKKHPNKKQNPNKKRRRRELVGGRALSI